MDYPSHMSIMMPRPGGIYGMSPVQMYPQNNRSMRRSDMSDAAALRSPLLDEFRTNKARKWELRVSQIHS